MVGQWVRALAISLNDLGLIPGKERTRSHELSSYLHEHVMVCSMCVGVEGQEKQAWKLCPKRLSAVVWILFVPQRLTCQKLSCSRVQLGSGRTSKGWLSEKSSSHLRSALQGGHGPLTLPSFSLASCPFNEWFHRAIYYHHNVLPQGQSNWVN